MVDVTATLPSLIHLKRGRRRKTLFICLKPLSRKKRNPKPKHIAQNSGNPDTERRQINACTRAHSSWLYLKACACCQFACVLCWKISTLGLMRSKQWKSILVLWLRKTSDPLSASVCRGPWGLSIRYTVLEVIGQPSVSIPAATMERQPP